MAMQIDFSDALFLLECGCILDGCSGSDPGQKWQEGVRNGVLHCTYHDRWVRLVDMVTTQGGPA
jgi:hypothetical protein